MSSPKYLAPLEVPRTDGRIDETQLESRVNELIDSNSREIIVNSRIFEPQISSDDERKRLIEMVSGYVSAKKSDVLVIADVTVGSKDYSFEKMKEAVGAEARMAKQAGASHLLIYPLFYAFETRHNVEKYLPEVLISFELPTIIASDPELHNGTGKGRNITRDELKHLAFDKPVCGLAKKYGCKLGIDTSNLPEYANIFVIKIKPQ